MRAKLALQYLCCLMAAVGSAQLAAADYERGPGLTFSLDVERNVSDWRINGSSAETRITAIGFSLYEPLSPRLRPGLHAGYLDLTQHHQPATEGLSLSGNYLGLSLNSRLVGTPRLGLDLDLGYTYNQVEDEQAGRKTQLAWHTLQGGLSVVYRLDRLEFLAGGSRYNIDGDQTQDGEPSRTLALENESGYSVGFNYWLDPSGHVGIHVARGAQRVTRLLFTRRF